LAKARAAAQDHARRASAPGAIQQSLAQQRQDIRLRVCITSVALLRYLCEHATLLPLSCHTRILDTHDLLMALVPLLENPPWTRHLTMETAPEDAAPVLEPRWEKLINF